MNLLGSLVKIRKKTEIAWWLMQLHGEYQCWKLFFAAIEPRKIGIFEIEDGYHAFIMKYDVAQGETLCLDWK